MRAFGECIRVKEYLHLGLLLMVTNQKPTVIVLIKKGKYLLIELTGPKIEMV